MGKVICGMTTSLDGFIEDSAGSVGRLYEDLAGMQDTDYMKGWIERTGAVLMGARTFAMAGDTDSYADSYEHQGPIFVVTSHPPARHPKENDRLTITFVTDGLESAVEQAKAAAGEKDVSVVGGPMVIQALLRAGLCDELHIDVVPVLLGEGKRLFDGLTDEGFRLGKVDITEIGNRISVQYGVLR